MKKSMLNFLFFIFIAFPGKAGNTDYTINMQTCQNNVRHGHIRKHTN